MRTRPVLAPTLVFALGLGLAPFAGGCQEEVFKTTPIQFLPGGTFTLGSQKTCSDTLGAACAGDHAEYRVTLNKFYIEAWEVSREQYQQCVEARVCNNDQPVDPWDVRQKDLPVRVARPEAASVYCGWLGQNVWGKNSGGKDADGRDIIMRLPTEAEYEYAARVGDDMKPRDYPWGDDAPKNCEVPVAGCPPRSSDVAGARVARGEVVFDKKGAGGAEIYDLAGNEPEWVAGIYDPQFSCADRLSYNALCQNDPACIAARCAADGASCLKGCLPSGIGQPAVPMTAEPVCAIAPADASPLVEPISLSGRKGYGLVRGARSTDRACDLAGYTRRHVLVDPKVGFGFRCVKEFRAPLPPASFRFALDGCPDPAWPVRVSVTTDGDAPVAYELHVYPRRQGAVTVRRPTAGVVENVACGEVFVVALPERGANIRVRVTDRQQCAAWADDVSIKGGDVPSDGFSLLQLKGNGPDKCKITNGVGDCTVKPCKTQCEKAERDALKLPDDGFRDCDKTFANGCEIDIDTDAGHCGQCGMTCGMAYSATVICAARACVIGACLAKSSDCDSELKNGCEVDLDTSAKHCGACRRACSPNHIANPTCGAAQCNGKCDVGWGDCNADKVADGCETDIYANKMACGDCNTQCGANQACVAGKCM